MSEKFDEGKSTELDSPAKENTSGGERSLPIGGGDTITGSIGSNARGAAIGKNIFQNIIVVGTVKIPVLPVLVLIGIVVAALAFFGFRSLGPDKMSGSFNLAVAEFGQEQADGKVVSTSSGQLISRRLFEGLQSAFVDLPSADQANFHPQFWQDSLDITQKRIKIGIIPGDTPQARWTSACALAEKINASVVIYGNLPVEGSGKEFYPEYAICDNPGLRMDADEITGVHQVVEGLSAQLVSQFGKTGIDIAANMVINRWSSMLTTFSVGIMYDLQGRADLALPTFKKAKEPLDGEKSKVKDVLSFFIGREELILAAKSSSDSADSSEHEVHLANAQTAFEEALGHSPEYARARIGLAGVFFDRAQHIPPAQRLETPDLKSAIQEYQQAITDAPAFPGVFIDTKARLGLAAALILQGETDRDLGKFQEAGDAFTQAIQAAEAALAPLTQAGQIRVLAQAYLTLGEANHEQGHLKLVQGDLASSRSFFQAASNNYGLCIQQKEADITDQVLADQIVAGLCQPYKEAVDASLSELGE